MSLDRGRGRMRVAITLRDQAEHKRCENEKGYSFFGRSEAEFLPHFIEFKTPDLFNQVANPSSKSAQSNPLTDYTDVLLGASLKQEHLIRIGALR